MTVQMFLKATIDVLWDCEIVLKSLLVRFVIQLNEQSHILDMENSNIVVILKMLDPIMIPATFPKCGKKTNATTDSRKCQKTNLTMFLRRHNEAQTFE